MSRILTMSARQRSRGCNCSGPGQRFPDGTFGDDGLGDGRTEPVMILAGFCEQGVTVAKPKYERELHTDPLPRSSATIWLAL
jgi:hypothetical protein